MRASRVVGTMLGSVALSFGMVAATGGASGASTPAAVRAPAPLVSRAPAGAARPRVTPPIGKQMAELVGSDTVANDSFGYSVAISGSTAVVGAPIHAEDAGTAYVFTDTKGVWKQVAELVGSDTVADDDFGGSVAISGSTVVVGARGLPRGRRQRVCVQ
jgi:hypothetical protein